MSGNKRTFSTTYDDFGSRFGIAVAFAVVGFIFVWLGSWFFALFMTAICGVMLIEWADLVRTADEIQSKSRALFVGGGAFSVFGVIFGVPALLAIAVTTFVAASFLNSKRFGLLTGSGYAAIVLGTAAAVHIRDLPAGFAILLWIVLCVVAADVGGYFFGRFLKGPKLAPKISPKKTWSGFIGGIVLSVAVALIFGLSTGGNAVSLILFGVLIAVVSVAGDIAESAVKRKVGVKDSGTILKGHGGFLDRLDAMTAVMVFFFALSLFVDLGDVFFPNYLATAGAGAL